MSKSLLSSISVLLGFSFILLSEGCAHRSGSRVNSDQSQETVNDQYGPAIPESGLNVDAAGSEPQTISMSENFQGYILLLGPGLARTMSYVGAFRELEAESVKIVGVAGVEFGALVAAMWASSNSNNLEWELFKLKRDDLLDFPLLSLKNTAAEGKRIIGFAQKAIKVDDLEKNHIKAYLISTQIKDDGSTDLLIESSGNAASVVRGALGIPGLIKPYYWENKLRVSAGLENPFPVQDLKNLLGLKLRKELSSSPSTEELQTFMDQKKILCLDAITSPNAPVGRDSTKDRDAIESRVSAIMRSAAALSKQQLKECDEVVTIDLKNTGYMDFTNQAELVYRGKLAVKKWLSERREKRE